MRFNCPQCGALYELADETIPAEGTTVQCSQCQNVFSVASPSGPQPPQVPAPVAPPTAPAPPPAVAPVETAEPGPNLTIQGTDGNSYACPDWATLQRWVVERRIGADDQLLQDGAAPTRLADVPELAPFLQVVTEPTPAVPAAPTEPPVQAAPPPAAHPPTPSPAPTPDPAPSAEDMFFASGASQSFDDDDAWDEPRRSGGGKMLIVFLLLAALGAGGYFAWPHLAGPQISDEALASLNQARDEMNRDHEAAFTKAEALLTTLPPPGGQLPKTQGMIVELSVLRGIYFAERAEEAVNITTEDEVEAKAQADKITKWRQQSVDLKHKARDVLEPLLNTHPEQRDVLRAAAWYQVAGKNYEQAEIYAQRAAKPEPTDHDALLSSVIATGKVPDAFPIRDYRVLVDRNSQLIRAQYRLAEGLVAQEKTDDAKTLLKELLDREPNHERAQALMASLETPVEAPKPKKKGFDADRVMEQADRMREGDRPERAIKLYQRVYQNDDEDIEALVGIGWCQLDMERMGAALTTFKRAIAESPRFADAHMGVAEAYRLQNQDKLAKKHYQKYLDLFPNGPDSGTARQMVRTLK